jgi:hypothetical protein
MDRVCKKCNATKPIEDFVKSKQCKHGHAWTCLDCYHKWSREHYEKNKATIRQKHRRYSKENQAAGKERVRRYRVRHKDEINRRNREARKTDGGKRLAYEREYREKNREKENEKSRRWRVRNRDKVKAYNDKYRAQNKEFIKSLKLKHRPRQNEIDRERRRTDPKWKLQRTISNYIYQTLNGRKLGRHWEYLVGYTVSDLRVHLEKQFQPGMSWANHGEWHIDHKIPITAFNFTKPEHEDFKRCWSLENLQPLWANENMSKNAKLNQPFQPFLAM